MNGDMILGFMTTIRLYFSQQDIFNDIFLMEIP